VPPGRYVVMAPDRAALSGLAGIERVVVDTLEHPHPY
jgi:hypothetical protein